VHLGFGQDQAAADLVLRGTRLLEQLLGSGVVVGGAAHHDLRLPGCPLME
jgi:hypothetical protein